jgi:PAS domain S-box-containing protein
MRWPFVANTRRRDSKAREIERDLKVLESQQALLDAARQTADAASFVTNRLRSKLQDSIDQIESTARIINDALVICDIDGMVQAFNPAAELLFGKKAEKVIGTYVGKLMDSNRPLNTGEDFWTVLAHLDEAEESGDLRGRRGKTTFPLDVNHTRLDRTDGTAIVLMVMRDISKDRDGHRLKNYRSIFESSFDGILVVKDDMIVAANPAVTKLFGYKVEELLVKKIGELLPTAHEDNEIVAGTHSDGHKMDMLFTTTTISWDGQPASLITVKDITATDIKPDTEAMVCCFDQDFRITFANAAFATFYGKKSSKLIGDDIRTLMSPEECNPFLININSLTPKEPTRRMQLRSSLGGIGKIQVWTDHANFDAGEVEYQRIGRDMNVTKGSAESS